MTAVSVPVLRGHGGALLRYTDGALTLRREDEEIRVPLEAIRFVAPDGPAVVFELRAPGGAPGAGYRVDGVNEAAAMLFATAVNDAAAELPEPDLTLDGATLVTTRSLRTPTAPRTPLSTGEKARGLGWGLAAFGPGLTGLIAMSVLVVANGEPGALVLSVILGVVAILLNLFSVYTMERAFQMWWLLRRGITVMAVRTSPYGKSGTYTYTDATGRTYSYFRQAYASEIEICYHPDAPGTAVGVYPPFVRVLVALVSLILWAATLGLVYLMILMGQNI
ncbi:hypothetical protein ACFY7C_11210 [Streptomyces sp. NPDC012769]|uniref:hypothetical protein n=1 Tax=Streptomyces sp. NPDC012769 TaxID=3364848 RepID=UPI0036AB00F2